MNKDFLGLAIIAITALSTVAYTQSTSMEVSAPTSNQVTAPVSTVTTTVQSATGTTTIETPSTDTTKITTTPGHSVMLKAKDGATVEMDSDNSVYVVYADGARTTAPDGIMALADGTTITVKEGKRIP